MALHRLALPQMGGDLFLTYTGMETDLLFTQGVDLPGFASYPLLETLSGRAHLERYYTDLIDVGRAAGTGVILEAPTWVANRDRGAEIGYSPGAVISRNAQAVEFISQIRTKCGDLPTLLSANIGPRADAYAPDHQMDATQAQAYHAEQIDVLAQTSADMISGYTIAYPQEAIGMVRAAQQVQMPIMIAFTVEQDGCLPTGTPLGDAIQTVDAATDHYASYFMINCAHPDHFASCLSDAPWMSRLRGLVANASRCSHAELDNATTMDDGDPLELGQQLAAIHLKYPNISILGGCCGTDMRHITSIAQSVAQIRRS